MGRIYFEILSELGFKSIDIIEKNKLKITTKKILNQKKLEFIALVMLMLKKDYFIVIVSTTTDKKFEFIEKIASKIKYLYIENQCLFISGL